MKWTSIIPAVILLCGLSACSLLQRHYSSGYYGQESSVAPDPAADFYNLRKAHDQQEALEEMGIDPTRPLGENEQHSLNLRLQLKRMEDEIPTKREKQQYYRYKAFLPGDLARITFLRIPSVEGRERWIQKLGISDDDSNGYSEDMAQIIENNDIVVGMSQKAVTESWGDPDMVEVAGSPVYRNERWKYSKYVSSEDGYRKEMRIIYFEGGRVVGWETL
ncbi:MAG: hypothetical protein H6624_17480 [Bdellovibrionaceae bacterium]|nr:hypothetical protein [Bdellovibrionales bacterium]MCB9086136.1 hypothetical protein [Pseudobdellovibrionaceae bacterium]